jgi:hypothetical protein
MSATSSPEQATAAGVYRGALLPPRLAGLGLLQFVRLADELVDRARHSGDDAGRHAGVMRRRLKSMMSKQSLDQPDIRAVLEQVGGEACRSVCSVTRLLIPPPWPPRGPAG